MIHAKIIPTLTLPNQKYPRSGDEEIMGGWLYEEYWLRSAKCVTNKEKGIVKESYSF